MKSCLDDMVDSSATELNSVDFNYMRKLDDDLFVCSAGNLEDIRSVWCARTSRTILPETKFTTDLESISQFLEVNVVNYNHASIGDMGFATVFHRGFGWLTARTLFDDPLFNGQETSTRAVNILKHFPDPCYDSSPKFFDAHKRFSKIFSELSAETELRGIYKFDMIRWSIPGTVQQGVVVSMNLRSFCRRLDYINHDFFARTRTSYIKGLMEVAPILCSRLLGKQRSIPRRYLYISTCEVKSKFETYEQMVEILPPFNFNCSEVSLMDFEPRMYGAKEMLDSRLNSLGLFKLTVSCSIAEARDWCRHRTAMPWNLAILTMDQRPFMNVLNDSFERYREEVESYMDSQVLNDSNFVGDLYGLPFGTMVRLTAYIPLNYLVYILELRSSAHGANHEYKIKAKQGLNLLKQILGCGMSDHFGIE